MRNGTVPISVCYSRSLGVIWWNVDVEVELMRMLRYQTMRRAYRKMEDDSWWYWNFHCRIWNINTVTVSVSLFQDWTALTMNERLGHQQHQFILSLVVLSSWIFLLSSHIKKKIASGSTINWLHWASFILSCNGNYSVRFVVILHGKLIWRFRHQISIVWLNAIYRTRLKINLLVINTKASQTRSDSINQM